MKKSPRNSNIFLFIVIAVLIAGAGWYMFKYELGPGLAIKPPQAEILIAVGNTAPAQTIVKAIAAKNAIEPILGRNTVETRVYSEVSPYDLKRWKVFILLNGEQSPTPTVTGYLSMDDNAPGKYVKAATAAAIAMGIPGIRGELHSELDMQKLGQAY